MKEELRMYTMVLYQLSGIQAGIQAGHSWVEYGFKCKDKELYEEWQQFNKTVMVLNGGTTSTMEEHIESLKQFGVDVVEFKEPDLNGITTAFSFILSESDYEFNDKMSLNSIYTYLAGLRFHGGR